MGVLHVTFPVNPSMHPASLSVARTPSPVHRPLRSRPLATSIVARQKQTAVPEPPVLEPSRGTLHPPQHSFEGQLEKTPEQIAEQEALARQVARCLAGDAEAWQQLVLSQHRRVYGICYRFTSSSLDAEDLTQEVFLKLYRNLASFDILRGSFSTWITTLTRNLLVDHFRRTRMDRATDSLNASFDGDPDSPTLADQLADPRPSQDQHVAGQELKIRLQAALKELSPELREAVILRDLEDMDYKEIAQVLRIPEGTVKSRISRGRGELARLLQRTEGQVV